MKIKSNTHLSTSFLQPLKSMFKVFIILSIFLVLPSCFFSANTAPTVDRNAPAPTKVGTHTVKAGETLYAIAWRYGLDYKRLAEANGVGNDFLIYVGQTLKLSTHTSNTAANNVVNGAKKSNAKKANNASSSRDIPSRVSNSKNVSRASHSSSTASAQVDVRSEKKASQSKAVTKSKWSQSKVVWRWPAKGKVITNFSAGKGANKGIDIKGKKGDSVHAAAAGKIVYAGDGLRGYGKLLIIKHNNTYLSAYAHNNRIHVKEGQIVKAGQHIADIGSSGSRTDDVKLHFEIRRNGKPVNPLHLLPKRKT